jgi:hypothetical protein
MNSGTGGPEGGSHGSVGSLGEEAAKLLHALQDWAGATGGEYADATATAAAGAASTWQRLNEHVATGAPECRYCPVCQAISAVRQTSPEVRAHLTSAASSLLQAAAGLLATQVPEDARGRSSDAGVEKIDVDVDAGDESGWEED